MCLMHSWPTAAIQYSPQRCCSGTRGRGSSQALPHCTSQVGSWEKPIIKRFGAFWPSVLWLLGFLLSFLSFFLPPPTSKLRSCRRARISAKHKHSSPMRSVRGNSFMSEKGVCVGVCGQGVCLLAFNRNPWGSARLCPGDGLWSAGLGAEVAPTDAVLCLELLIQGRA